MRLQPKTKMVSFRISADQYRLCHQALRLHGVRNISELARVALEEIIESNNSRDHRQEVHELRERVRMLSADIERYAEMLGSGREEREEVLNGGAQ